MKTHAVVIPGPKQEPLYKETFIGDVASDQVLVKVKACGVCRTDLHVLDSELPDIKYPVVPGHEVVGVIEALGQDVKHLTLGQRVVVPWLAKTCANCVYCRNNMENLCSSPLFTGYTTDGGFAEYMLAYADFCFPAPKQYSDIELAPLICAGLIGWRSYKFADCKNSISRRLGIYGFGAAAHIITQVAVYDKLDVYAFTREGDLSAQNFALDMGVKWAGSSEQSPPEELDAAIIFAPVGCLVKKALQAVRKGGVVVCGGIHMSDIPALPYELLWGERKIVSVANLTRQDALEFLELAPKIPVRTKVHEYKLEEAQKALGDLREGTFSGAAVLVP